MATVNLKFRPSSVPHAKGTLYYQLIYKRNVRWISTGHRIYASEWDEQSSMILLPPDVGRRTELQLMQSSIACGLKRRREILHQLELAGNEMSVDELCEAFNGLPPCRTVFGFLQEQVARQKQMARLGTTKTYQNAYRRFKEFRGGIDLTFIELTPDLIERYEAWLTNRGLQPNTIRFYLRTLHTLLYKAVGSGLLAEDRKLFSRVRMSYVQTTKRAISENSLRAIARLPLPQGSTIAFARDVFMFSFYMRGMPFVDIAFLKKSDLHCGMLEYCRKKTNQRLSVEWEGAQQAIVRRYAHLTQDTPYMLPIIRRTDGTEHQQYKRMQENINRSLKKIGEKVGLKIPLTTYVARHTWASIARNMNFPLAIISEGMGHRSYKTTQVYLDSIDTSRIDEANKKIIQRINR